jgi:hypothetical protein
MFQKRNSAVVKAARLQAEYPRNRGLILGWSKGFATF